MVKPKKVENLTADVSLEEAANTLHRAADLAEKTNDNDAMMNVVAGWLEVHERFTGVERDKPKQIGFCSSAESTDLIEVEEEEEYEIEEEE